MCAENRTSRSSIKASEASLDAQGLLGYKTARGDRPTALLFKNWTDKAARRHDIGRKGQVVETAVRGLTIDSYSIEDLRQLIDTAIAPIFGIALDGTVNEWNQQAVAVTGYTRDEVFGKDLVQNYISPDYQEAVQRVLQAVLIGNVSIHPTRRVGTTSCRARAPCRFLPTGN